MKNKQRRHCEPHAFYGAKQSRRHDNIPLDCFTLLKNTGFAMTGVLIFCLIALLVGCGQTGKLYLPEQNKNAQQSQ